MVLLGVEKGWVFVDFLAIDLIGTEKDENCSVGF